MNWTSPRRATESNLPTPKTPPYKGVVYNEMKGAMSSVPSQLWQTLCKYIFPTSTYHHNSGGDPESIPDLSYQQLKAFYRTHYHPSNAIFMTFGDIDAAEHQAKFEDQALSRFEPLAQQIAVADEKRYYAPVRAEEAYALSDSDSLEDKSHIVMGWLLGKSTNLEESLKAQLLSSVLFDNSASPLQQALETTDLGTAPSPLCGLDDSQRELSFCCGVEGSNPEQAEAVEQLILDTLQKVADEGVPQQQIEASLHQLELQQREIGGDSYPYGLQLILTSLTAATHRGDPLQLLNLEPALQALRDAVADPNFIQDQVRELLLNNPHRVRLTLRPDAELAERKTQAEIQRLATLKAGLDARQQQQIINQSQALLARQEQQDDDSLLPKVGLEDIPAEMHYTAGKRVDSFPQTLTEYHSGTNGLVYQQIICKLPELSQDLQKILPFYCICLTELGIGSDDYLASQRRQAETVGAINSYSTVRGASDDVQHIDAYLTLSAKALTRNQADMSSLMLDTLERVRFDELGRIRELISQVRARREQSITGSGHSLAMAAACAGMSPAAKFSHQLSGLGGIAFIKALDDSLKDEQQLQDFAQQLESIHQRLLAAPKQYLLVGEQEFIADYQRQLQAELASSPQSNTDSSTFKAFQLAPVSESIQQGWLTNTQVNFCARAYPTVAMEHPDAAALTVLGGFLRNGYLHRAIREQGGAYGSGASQDSNIAAFRFFSYRDPRMAETLADFDAAIDWLQDNNHEARQLEEAILGVISSIDKPSSPAGEAKQTFHAELFGRDRAKREAFRNRVLEVSLDDLQRVSRTYLCSAKASTVVVSHAGQEEALKELGLEVISL